MSHSQYAGRTGLLTLSVLGFVLATAFVVLFEAPARGEAGAPRSVAGPIGPAEPAGAVAPRSSGTGPAGAGPDAEAGIAATPPANTDGAATTVTQPNAPATPLATAPPAQTAAPSAPPATAAQPSAPVARTPALTSPAPATAAPPPNRPAPTTAPPVAVPLAPSAVPTNDYRVGGYPGQRAPAAGSQPRIDAAPGGATGTTAASARPVEAIAANGASFLPGPEFGLRIFAAGLIALAISIGGLVTMAVRRRHD